MGELGTAPTGLSLGTSKVARLWAAQGGRCFYCAGLTYLVGRETRREACERLKTTKGGLQKIYRATIEHLHRRCEGGTNALANLRMACLYCNTTRGESPVEDHACRIAEAVKSGRHPNRFAKRTSASGPKCT